VDKGLRMELMALRHEEAYLTRQIDGAGGAWREWLMELRGRLRVFAREVGAE
jgi:hypothetical protein